MATLTFDVAAFRLQFPAFANETTFPDEMLQMYWDMATCYISDDGSYGWLQGTCRQLAINLMTAHLTALSVIIAGGEVPGIVNSATIDKVSVTLTPPPLKTEWQWWLLNTPYGAQLYALLTVRSSGGWYRGGMAPLAGFNGTYPYPGSLC